jgi:ribonuclease BN (tRNA processing enzyme)
MHIHRTVAIAHALLAISPIAFGTEHNSCGASSPMALQLLGTGGPISHDARASSGAIVWIDGKSRLLFDAGGGVYLRFGQAGARLEDLRFIGLSHFHTDHSADLPALLKGAYFMATTSTLTLAGPTGSDTFPSTTAFFKAMFGASNSAYPYLHGLRDGTDGIKLTVSPIVDVDVSRATASLVYKDAQVKVFAYGIPHGKVPTLAYRVEGHAGTIVISADQNGRRDGFVSFARGADILVMPLAIDEDADAASAFLHATPTVVGNMAAKAAPKMLVLDHFMGRALIDKDVNAATVGAIYHGPVVAARDLSCYPLPVSTQEHDHAN